MLPGIHGNRRVTPGGITRVRPGAQSKDWNAVRILALGVIASDGLIETRIIRGDRQTGSHGPAWASHPRAAPSGYPAPGSTH